MPRAYTAGMPDARPSPDQPIRILLTLSPAMLAELDRIARRAGMDRSNLVRAILAEWLDKDRRWTDQQEPPDAK